MASSTKMTGADGAVSIGGTVVAITDWEISISTDTKDVTDSTSSTWKETLANGFKGWSGSFSGWYLDGTLSEVVTTGVAEAGIFTSEAAVTLTGNLNITSKSIACTIDGGDAVKASYQFVCDGALTEANP